VRGSAAAITSLPAKACRMQRQVESACGRELPDAEHNAGAQAEIAFGSVDSVGQLG
jgi:hypothetical protein